MRSLLKFLERYNNIILFLLLEAVAIIMLARNEGYQNIVISNKLMALDGAIEKRISGATDYFRLRSINSTLTAENIELKNRLENVFRDDEQYFTPINDTVHKQQFVYRIVRVIKQSVNRQKNYLTLDKGSKDGIEPGMAVIGPDGIVGTVVGVSRNFAVAMSVLNTDFRLSARFRKNGYFGSLSWNGVSRERVSLNEIPHHVSIQVGDTIETSGYSSVFPTGIMVGVVRDYNSEGGDFITLDVDLSTDFSGINYVYVVGNLMKDEQVNLQKRFE